MTQHIIARGLSVRHANGFAALTEVDLSVDRGQFVALVGSNGAGKSTLLRSLVRLVEPTGGAIQVAGTDVRAASGRRLRRLRREVGFVFQHINLVDRASVFHNVVHGASGREGFRCAVSALSPGRVRAEAMDCLARVGLADLAARRVDTLSGGQRQRVAIARTLMQRPTIVLADEPIASLDPAAGRAVMDLLRDVARERTLTVVAALHQVDLALEYTDRLVGLRAGRLVLDQPAGSCSDAQIGRMYAEPVLQEAV